MTKEVALIGASGFVGSAILSELIKRGYKVEALVRNPEKIKPNPNVIVKKIDVSNTPALADALKGYDSVISAYNPGWTNPEIGPLTVPNNTSILRAAKEAGVKRILFVGGAGTLFIKPGLTVIDAGLIPDSILSGVKAFGDFFLNTLKKENDIDWVFFSPAGSLDPGEAKGGYRLGKDDIVVDANGESHINVGDYAVAMVNELENPAHHKERFTIGY